MERMDVRKNIMAMATVKEVQADDIVMPGEERSLIQHKSSSWNEELLSVSIRNVLYFSD